MPKKSEKYENIKGDLPSRLSLSFQRLQSMPLNWLTTFYYIHLTLSDCEHSRRSSQINWSATALHIWVLPPKSAPITVFSSSQHMHLEKGSWCLGESHQSETTPSNHGTAWVCSHKEKLRQLPWWLLSFENVFLLSSSTTTKWLQSAQSVQCQHRHATNTQNWMRQTSN